MKDRREYKRKWYQKNKKRLKMKHQKLPQTTPLTKRQLYAKRYYLKNRKKILAYANAYNKM